MVENNTYYNELYSKYHTINKQQNGKPSIEALSEPQVRVKNTAKSNKKENKYNQDSWKNEGGDPSHGTHTSNHLKEDGIITKPKINKSSRRNSKFEHHLPHNNESKEKLEQKEDPFGKLLLLNSKQPQTSSNSQKNGLFHNRTKEKSSTKIILTKTDQEYFNVDVSKGSRRKSALVTGNIENRLGAESSTKKSLTHGVKKHEFENVPEQAELHEDEENFEAFNLGNKVSSHLLKPTSFQVKQSKIIIEDDEKDFFSHQSEANNNDISLIKEKIENDDRASSLSDIYRNDQQMSNGKNQPNDHQPKVSEFIDSSFDSDKSLKNINQSLNNQKLSIQRSAHNLKEAAENAMHHQPIIHALKTSSGPAAPELKSQLNTIKIITTDKEMMSEKMIKGMGGATGPIIYERNNARSPKQSSQNTKKKFLGCLNLCY